MNRLTDPPPYIVLVFSQDMPHAIAYLIQRRTNPQFRVRTSVLRTGLASLHDLPRLTESGSLQDRKEFVRAFLGGVTVVLGEGRLDVRMRTLPELGALLPSNSTVGLVAGARYEPVPIEMKPVGRFLAGLKRVA